MRALTSLLGNSQRLDGGSMFGNAPKALWTRWITPDERNRIPLACRALLVEEDHRRILFEAGIGAFFPPKLRDRFGVQDEHILLQSLQARGLSHEDIDLVVLSHMHFDHVGGLLTPFSPDTPHALLFPNATFLAPEGNWKRACDPHQRDRASFIPELHALLEQSGRLVLVPEGTTSHPLLGADYTLHTSHGHTPGMMLTEIAMPEGPVVFVADLAPGAPWVHLPITMGYDRAPEQLVDEKAALFALLIERNARLFFTHDPQWALGRLARDERGRYHAHELTEHIRALST